MKQWTVGDLKRELGKHPDDLLVNLEDSDGYSSYALNAAQVGVTRGGKVALLLTQYDLDE